MTGRGWLESNVPPMSSKYRWGWLLSSVHSNRKRLKMETVLMSFEATPSETLFR